jgi:hypothetical protein
LSWLAEVDHAAHAEEVEGRAEEERQPFDVTRAFDQDGDND